MPVPEGFTVSTNSPNSTEAVHSPDLGSLGVPGGVGVGVVTGSVVVTDGVVTGGVGVDVGVSVGVVVVVVTGGVGVVVVGGVVVELLPPQPMPNVTPSTTTSISAASNLACGLISVPPAYRNFLLVQ